MEPNEALGVTSRGGFGWHLGSISDVPNVTFNRVAPGLQAHGDR
jgi:hypothetical protein